jgi:hypothetical protein
MIPSEEKGRDYPHNDSGGDRSAQAEVRILDHCHRVRPGRIHHHSSDLQVVEVTSVATVVGAVASLVGTVVGAFFGVQVGAVGKDRAEASRERSDELARAALSMLPPETAQQLRSEMGR